MSFVVPRPAVTIRPFSPSDYDACAVIHNAAFPDYPEAADEMRFDDESRDPKIRWARFVAASDNGDLVATASYDQDGEMYHPRKFSVDVTVRPDHEGRGIGSAVYDHVMNALAPFDPLIVRALAREDKTRAVAFLERRGFVEEMRDWESRLDVAVFDFAPFAAAAERVRAQNIAITTLAAQVTDPDRDQKLYELDWAVVQDMPAPDTLTKPAFDVWRKRILDNPNLLPDAWFLALDAAGNYIGESTLWKTHSADLDTGATGVVRAHRKKGIALALKLRAIAYAKAVGCPTIKTWNEVNNQAMLGINETLGFARQPAWIGFAKTLKEEETQ